MPRSIVSPDLRALARRQSGVISTTQLQGLGLSRKSVYGLTGAGFLVGVAAGVYALWPGDWMQSAWTVVLVGGDHAVLGGLAAAHLHGLVEAPDVIDCYCAARSSREDARWRLIRAERRGRGEPPRTSLAQTVVDASIGMTADEIAAMLARAGRRLPRQEIVEVLAATGRHPRRAVLREMVEEVAAGAESPLEVRYVREVERRHRLPPARRQGNPSAVGRVDSWYAEYGVIVEVDGRRYHDGLAASGDSVRDNAHIEAGIVTLRFSWRQVAGDPCAVAAQVARVLRLGGWSGDLAPCRRCPAR